MQLEYEIIKHNLQILMHVYVYETHFKKDWFMLIKLVCQFSLYSFKFNSNTQ